MQSKMPFKCTISLKQHTPLIHFQYKQEGVSLRATEVKPKLDRFIRTELQKCAPELYNTYKEEGIITSKNFPDRIEDKRMSSYKLRIRSKKVEEYLISSHLSRQKRGELDAEGIAYIAGAPYFANEKQIKANAWKDPELKKGIVCKDIELEVFSFEPKIVELLKETLPYFFVYHNFGTRQSKGFGSFSVAQSRADFEKKLLAHPDYAETLSITTRPSRNNPYEAVFKKINQEYKILKSGDQDQEEASRMMLYFEDKGIDWEKEKIKNDLIKPRHPKRITDYSTKQDVKYVRALLGLAELYEFPRDRTKVCIKCENGEIKRFRSPLTFKVFEHTIYILVHEIPDALFNKTFRFSTPTGASILINTPTGKSDFDLKDFLKNHVDEFWNYVEA